MRTDCFAFWEPPVIFAPFLIAAQPGFISATCNFVPKFDKFGLWQATANQMICLCHKYWPKSLMWVRRWQGGDLVVVFSLNCFVNALGTKVWSSRHHPDARGNWSTHQPFWIWDMGQELVYEFCPWFPDLANYTAPFLFVGSPWLAPLEHTIQVNENYCPSL
jgi:hypothetical protein